MLKIDDTAVVLVDFQGKLARVVRDSEQVIEAAVKLARGAGVLGLPIIHTEQNPAGLGPTVEQFDGLLPSKPIAKQTFSCWREPAFADALSDLKRHSILLAGIESHVCVYQTAVDLRKAHYDVHVVAEAISSRTDTNRHVGLDRMAVAGATITSVEMALFELLETAGPQGPGGGDKFRNILKIIK